MILDLLVSGGVLAVVIAALWATQRRVVRDEEETL